MKKKQTKTTEGTKKKTDMGPVRGSYMGLSDSRGTRFSLFALVGGAQLILRSASSNCGSSQFTKHLTLGPALKSPELRGLLVFHLFFFVFSFSSLPSFWR